MSLHPTDKPVVGTYALETAIAIILRIRPALYAALAFAAGAVTAWMMGG